jgi:hypothetical protein
MIALGEAGFLEAGGVHKLGRVTNPLDLQGVRSM